MTTDTSLALPRRVVTVSNMAAMPEYAGAFTASALRHLVFQAESRTSSRGETISGNGLEQVGAIIRLGRKVLIDLDRFDVWLASHRASTEEPGS